MAMEDIIVNNWYAARYESGFSIIFRVLETGNEGFTLRRKDGAIVNTIPAGYTEIVPLGEDGPEYE